METNSRETKAGEEYFHEIKIDDFETDPNPVRDLETNIGPDKYATAEDIRKHTNQFKHHFLPNGYGPDIRGYSEKQAAFTLFETNREGTLESAAGPIEYYEVVEITQYGPHDFPHGDPEPKPDSELTASLGGLNYYFFIPDNENKDHYSAIIQRLSGDSEGFKKINNELSKQTYKSEAELYSQVYALIEKVVSIEKIKDLAYKSEVSD